MWGGKETIICVFVSFLVAPSSKNGSGREYFILFFLVSKWCQTLKKRERGLKTKKVLFKEKIIIMFDVADSGAEKKKNNVDFFKKNKEKNSSVSGGTRDARH